MPQGPPLVQERPFLIMDHPLGVVTLPLTFPDIKSALVAWGLIMSLADPGHHDRTVWSIAWATESRLVHYRSEHRRNA